MCREAPIAIKDCELGACGRSWLLAVREGSVTGNWLNMLKRSGLTKYRLNAGFGCRWWLDCVLTEFKGFFTTRYDDARLWLRIAWSGTSEPVHPGEMQRLRKGVWV
ncbi:hypothetical protein K469DRAFT_703440 [Zopfia rhizophila CBS 207.26]|nr:hypothetical protein K469DRAFT_703440 [Zopfia rhizophila CBS 207.26]